jgi:hypothetical protein
VSPLPSDPGPGGFVFPRRLAVGDVSVIHPAAASFAVGAARTLGFAAAARDAPERRAYQQVSSALPFVPILVESFRRLGALALTVLRDLADQAVQAGGPGLSRAAFISGALRALLCGMFVQLQLALFPAGGPFLPSLSVNLLLPARPVSGPVCGFGVFGSALLCVA